MTNGKAARGQNFQPEKFVDNNGGSPGPSGTAQRTLNTGLVHSLNDPMLETPEGRSNQKLTVQEQDSSKTVTTAIQTLAGNVPTALTA